MSNFVITTQQALELHRRLILVSGGADGCRDLDSLESALARPFAAFGEHEFYPEPIQKAAALLESVVVNHPFVDGNKRSGYVLANLLLFKFGLEIVAEEDDKYNAVIAVASGEWKYDQIVSWMQTCVQARR